MKKQHPNQKAGRSPVSVRLTPEERAELLNAAGDMSLSRYIRSRLFQPDSARTISDAEDRISPIERQKMLAQILSELGKSGLSKSLAELSELARLGLLPPDTDIAKLLCSTKNELEQLRLNLLRALGLRPKDRGQK